MVEFHVLQTAILQKFADMSVNKEPLFVSDVDSRELWTTYLDSFPEGTNELYKERREYDCQCCKSFIRRFGHVVTIKNNKMVSIWDVDVPHPFKEVVKTLSRFVKSGNKIRDAFFSKEATIGAKQSHQQVGVKAITWEHFYIKLPNLYVKRDIAPILGGIRDSKQVFQRSMEELTLDAGQTILELITQGSLYKGAEFKSSISEFIATKVKYDKVPVKQKDVWCWEASRASTVSRIRNSAIGTLLINLSEGMELDTAVGKFEAVVAPTNYKRPKAIVTKRMVEEAQKKIEELGYTNSLGRQHAVLDDITINDVLFLHRDSKKSVSNVFDQMKEEVPISPKKLSKLEEVPISDFIANILPSAKSVQLLLENRHQGNLMNLVAPLDKPAPSMLKWDNNFSWSYNGDIADSMKQNVKSAGGDVEGVLRFSIQWNDGDNNQNDFDAHCIEPKGNLIYYGSKRNASTTGKLDVDIINPGRKVAVENITWTNKSKMQEGRYQFMVHNYNHKGGTTGFTAEIEYEGEVYSYSYSRELRNREKVLVADIVFSKTDGITFTKSLDSTYSQKELWGVKTNSFVEVSSLMRSPNYWEGESKKGNEHYFFFLNGCLNPNNPRGFYNEFLRDKLMDHKRVFEVLGSKMRVEYSNNQLAGVGFSTTQRNSVIAKVEGSFNRTIKINF